MDKFIKDKLQELGKDYFMTEFDLVNDTDNIVTYDLFNSNTLNVVDTQPVPILPPSIPSNVNIAVGSNPIDIVYCPTNNTLYIADAGDNTITGVNLNTKLVTFVSSSTIGTPNRILYNDTNNYIYVLLNGTGGKSIRIIDCVTNLDVTTIVLPFVNTYSFSLNTTNNKIYVTADGNIGIVDCATNTYVSSVPTPVGTTPLGITFCFQNNTMYISETTTNVVYVLNCSSNIITATIPVGTAPLYLQYCSQNNTVYVPNYGSSDVSVIDCDTNSVISTVIIGDSIYTFAYNNVFNIMYGTLPLTNGIVQIDCSSNTITSTTASGGSFPTGISYDAFVNRYFYTNTNSDSITIVAPSVFTTTYIGGSYNYNQYILDKQDNPFLVMATMLYSNDERNINQVFFLAVKNANGQRAYVPQYPQLSIPTSQMQKSVAKVTFGKKGFIMDVESYFYDFKVYPRSSMKVILIQKQFKKSSILPYEEPELDIIKNDIQHVKGVDLFNNIEFFRITNNGK